MQLNINFGGGLINHILIKHDKVYRFVEDGLMVYNYSNESMDTLIEKMQEQEYDSNFIKTIEYSINVFDSINKENIELIVQKYDK